MKFIAMAIFLLLLLFAQGTFEKALASDEDEAQAEKAALNWLNLVDQCKYPQSWREAASTFKTRVAKPQWQAQIKAARTPLGKLISRKVKSRTYATTLPGAPDGQYVVIQFEAQFAKKASAIETITPQKDKDGEWRVSGYFIR